jgi:hypothetical protein
MAARAEAMLELGERRPRPTASDAIVEEKP